MDTIPQDWEDETDESEASGRRRPWHWLLWAAALLVGGLGAWTLWSPMPMARPLPGPALEVTPLKDVASASGAIQHKQVHLRGQFREHVVALEGRDMAGRRGYYVVQPFTESGEGGQTILVLRGWVPPTARGTVENYLGAVRHDEYIHGRLALPDLGDEAKAASETGKFRRNLSLSRFAGETGLSLLPVVVLQQPGPAWDEKSIRVNLFKMRWPALYPRDRYIRPGGYGLLALAAVLAAMGVRAWRGRRPARVAGRSPPPARRGDGARKHQFGD